jgi:hypothetical protein
MITSGGAVKCWGYNGNGELGIESSTDQTSPVDVAGAEEWREYAKTNRSHHDDDSSNMGSFGCHTVTIEKIKAFLLVGDHIVFLVHVGEPLFCQQVFFKSLKLPTSP